MATAMNRQEFLQLFGLGAAGLVASACLGACSSKSEVSPASGVDFTVDLTAASSAALNDPATGYIYGAGNTVIVARTTAGSYVALQAPCPHQGTNVYFTPGQSRFVCPNHGAVFGLTGNLIQGPATTGLKQYTVVQTGTSLRVTG